MIDVTEGGFAASETVLPGFGMTRSSVRESPEMTVDRHGVAVGHGATGLCNAALARAPLSASRQSTPGPIGPPQATPRVDLVILSTAR